MWEGGNLLSLRFDDDDDDDDGEDGEDGENDGDDGDDGDNEHNNDDNNNDDDHDDDDDDDNGGGWCGIKRHNSRWQQQLHCPHMYVHSFHMRFCKSFPKFHPSNHPAPPNWCTRQWSGLSQPMVNWWLKWLLGDKYYC